MGQYAKEHTCKQTKQAKSKQYFRMCHLSLEKTNHVPPFNKNACGTRSDWNILPLLAWNQQRAIKEFPLVPGAIVDPQCIFEFLILRFGPDNMPVSERIDPPQSFAGDWFRCQWLRLLLLLCICCHWLDSWRRCFIERIRICTNWVCMRIPR